MSKKSIKSTLRLANVYFGNVFEHYDTALYSFLSPFFAKILFPKLDGLTALILTFGIAPLGMIARPFGSLFFGFIGDTQGRSRALFLSLAGMAIVTALVGLMPTAAQIGSFAPILLLLSRILQNFFAAGEVTGGAIYYLESVENQHQKDIASSIYGTSTVVGILLASMIVATLYHFDLVETGWRWLYAAGACTALCGVFVRLLCVSEPLEQKPETHFTRHFFERLKSIYAYKKTVFVIAIASGFSYATYLTAFSLMNGFVPLISSITDSEITKVNTALLLVDIILLPICGIIAHRYNRIRMMQVAALSAAIFGIPLFALLENCTMMTLIFVRLCFVVIGVAFFATFYSWAESLVPKQHRYSVISFAYSIGSQTFGGTAATLSLWFFKKTSLVTSAGWYWMLLGAFTCLCLYKMDKESEGEKSLLVTSST